ncbi:hypothetical protein DFH94DRAFT_360973 [Russula ochroleuca]|uniref:NACHT domain-containing protein n=1 Tax=Russula ochroleuca TaxID=152965 RepID=A0A9P5MKR2_9AGAM|nr:hypothetical protein DFH94DRAFT_106483 [Russula ochroleuca]KAF8465155.1 hypothetical protein DFH94DRAFT_360973 [Russula ochroleuca]
MCVLVGNSRRRQSYPYRSARPPRRASPLPFTITTRHPPVVLSLLSHISSIFNMSRPSSPLSFRTLFNTALQDYESQTGTRLVDHPLSKQLEACDSVDSITATLQEQAQIFRKFRGDDGKLMKSLKSSVDVLYTLSISTVLGEGIGLPFPPAKAIFAGIAVLLAAVKDIDSSYDALVDLFTSFNNFIGRLSIYTGIPPTPALTNVLVKIIVELLSTLALATKQVKQGRIKKFVKKLRGENDIEATLQRLDRLTLDEARATAAQTLEVVYGLVQQRKAVMEDGNESAPSISGALESIQEIVSKMNKAERDKVRQDVRNWFSPPDPWKNHNVVHESRHSRTGSWLIQGDTYEEWKSSGSSSLLWINGKPGSGKSVICSAIIEDIRTLQKSGMASLAFFYCDFREDQKKDKRGLLSSLLVQLCEQSDAYSSILSDFYVAHGRGSQHASDNELVAGLKDMLKLPGQASVYIVIDALDECPVTTGLPSPREKVLELVEDLVNSQIPNLRICVTSRPEVDIVSILDPLAFRSVSLHGESGQVEDIAEYVRFVVHTDREMRRWKATDKQLVIDELIKKANGMSVTRVTITYHYHSHLQYVGSVGCSVSSFTSAAAFQGVFCVL